MVYDPKHGCVRNPFERAVPRYPEEVPLPPELADILKKKDIRKTKCCGTWPKPLGPEHEKDCPNYREGFVKTGDPEPAKEFCTSCGASIPQREGEGTCPDCDGTLRKAPPDEDCITMPNGTCVSPYCDLHNPLPELVEAYNRDAYDEAQLERAWLRKFMKDCMGKPDYSKRREDESLKERHMVILGAVLDLLDRFGNTAVVSAFNLVNVVLQDLEK